MEYRHDLVVEFADGSSVCDLLSSMLGGPGEVEVECVGWVICTAEVMKSLDRESRVAEEGVVTTKEVPRACLNVITEIQPVVASHSLVERRIVEPDAEKVLVTSIHKTIKTVSRIGDHVPQSVGLLLCRRDLLLILHHTNVDCK